MKAQETPSGTRMMWKARVNAICERAHGTGSAVETAATTWTASFTITSSVSSRARGSPPARHGPAILRAWPSKPAETSPVEDEVAVPLAAGWSPASAVVVEEVLERRRVGERVVGQG